MKIYDAHQDIAANIQLVTKKDFFKRNKIDEGYIDSIYKCVNQVDYPRLKEGGVKLVFATIFAQTKEQAIEQFDIYKEILDSDNKIIPILTKENLIQLKNDEVGFLFNMEGFAPLEDKNELNIFYELGLRSIGISWRGANKYIDGDKLSEDGVDLLKLIEEKKIILDLAHISEPLFWNVVNSYSRPFIVSHTACRSIHNDERNLSDKQISEIKNRDSLIGIAGVNLLVGGEKISNIVDNIQHAIKHSSINHVCLGSDFDGMVNPKLSLIKDFEDASCFPKLISELSLSLNQTGVKQIAYENLHNFILKIL